MPNAPLLNHPLEKLEEAISLKKQITALECRLSSLFSTDSPSTCDMSKMDTAERKRFIRAQNA